MRHVTAVNDPPAPGGLERALELASRCLERWEAAAARSAAEQARSLAVGWGDAASAALAEVLLARASLITSAEPSAKLVRDTVRRQRTATFRLAAALDRFDVELAAASGTEPGAGLTLPEPARLAAGSPTDLVAAVAMAGAIRLDQHAPDLFAVAAAPAPAPPPEGDHGGWQHVIAALDLAARGDDVGPAVERAIQAGEQQGNRALLWTALTLAAASSARRGSRAEEAAARQGLVRLVETWATTLPPGEAAAAVSRPDRARARAWSRGAITGAAPTSRLIEVALSLADERSVDRLVDLALDAAIQLTGADRGLLLLLDEDRAPRAVAARYGGDEARAQELIGLSSTIARRALEGGEVVVSQDVRNDTRFAECSSLAIEVTSVLCAPIHARAERQGAIYLDRRARGRSFDEAAVAAARAVGSMLAAALLNARTIASLEARTRELDAAREELSVALRKRTVERDDMSRRLADLDDVVPAGTDGIIGRAPVMLRMRRAIQNFATADVPVLVAGETGSGKDLVARALHGLSNRRDRPFVAVNCGALSETLLAAELFGAERGAYTGATAARPGLFLAADGGTLFLDEVGDMPSAMQAALLRVLETSEIRPVGSVRVRKVDVRLIAASHRDLVDLARRGTFRDDLRYRLEVVRIEVPPLRERLEDLPELSEYLLREIRSRYGLPERRLAAEAIQALSRRLWPGNVRELRHVLASAALTATGAMIQRADLPPERAAAPPVLRLPTPVPATPPAPADALGDDVDGHALRVDSIRRALKATAGHRARAAQLLGIARSTFYRYLDLYGIDAQDFDRPDGDRDEP
jgi:transcriptional regulator with GAF, ATPase, and Fis domain